MPLPWVPASDQASPALLAPEAVARIVSGLGSAAYEWHIAQDRLEWSPNVTAVLGIEDAARLAHGLRYGAMVVPDSGTSRHDAVMSGHLDGSGAGVAFATTYCLRFPMAGEFQNVWVEDRGLWFADSSGRPGRVQGIVRRLDAASVPGSLTPGVAPLDLQAGSFGRQHLSHLLEERLADAARYRSQFGFLLVSVDHLGRLNDAYGFEVADEVVETVGQRLRSRMRGHDEIGRFSGNKFGIVLRDCSPDDMAIAAQRFLDAVSSDALQTRGGAVAATVTAGGVIAPRHAREVPEIFARAQDALDRAKGTARGTFQPHHPSIEREAARRANLKLTDNIVSALSERRVTLAFQPIARVASRRIAMHECLVRIHGSDGRKVLDGAAIVPVAEKFGLMRLLDCRVLELALDALAADPGLRLSVNVSPSTFHDRAWLALLEGRARRELGERLIVELTETAAIQDVETTRPFVHRLRDLGCTVAMDDFGAGYTSFRNLRRLGVDMVKVDGSFVRMLRESEDDQFFVRTLLSLARYMGIETVAEWVPDEATAALLLEWGCDYLQGELIGLATENLPVAAA